MSFSFEDIQIVLNSIANPVLIADYTSHRIIFGNDELFNLVQYQINDIVGGKLEDWITGLNLSSLSDGMIFEGTIIRKNDHPIKVKCKCNIFGKKTKYLFLTIDPSLSKKVQDGSFEKRLINFQESIFSEMTLLKTDDLYEKIIEFAKSILFTDHVNIYLPENSDDVYLHLFRTNSNLPQRIPYLEAVKINNIDFWEPGSRVIFEIHRAARKNNFSTVISFPFHLDEKKIGLFVFFLREIIRENGIREEIRIFSRWINGLTKNFYDVSVLKKEIVDSSIRLDKSEIINQYSSDAYVVFDNNDRIIDYNDQFLQLTQFSPIDIYDQGISLIIKNPNIFEDLSGKPGNNSSINNNQQVIYDKKGNKIPVRLQGKKVKWAEAENQILVISDIRAEKFAEEKLLQIENKAALGEVISDFAHEVRNPINNLTTGLQLLSIKLKDNDSLKEIVSRMQDDCIRMSHLMESVLAFSKQRKPDYKDVEILGLINRIISKIQNKSKNKDISIIIKNELANENSIIQGDQRSLEQVFINVITNAIEAITQTPGIISVVISAVKEKPQHILVKIADTGSGIPSDFKEKIFQPFISDKQSGTGLGLAIVKRIIDAHNGKIEIETFPGGTIFYIFLPIHNKGE